MEFGSSKRTARRREKQSVPQFCMVCLNTSEDCKLYAASMYNLDMEYEHLTGISLQGDMHFEPQFCTECTQRLSNCVKFRDKSLRAFNLLVELVDQKPLTIQNIKILSKSNNLTSSLAKKSFQPDYCDLNLNHEELQKQAKLLKELTKNKPIKVQPDLLNKKLIKTQEQAPNNEPIKTQEDFINNEPIKIEVKLFDSNGMLSSVPDLENKVEPKSLDDSHSDFDMNIDNDDDLSDIDIQLDKRIKDKVDKFMNDVMNDTDNDWDFLKDSDSDNDSVSGTKTEIKINVKKEHIRKPRTVRRKRDKVKSQMGEDKLECLKYFNVTELTREEQLEDIQKRKEKKNYINGNFKCKICFKGFLNKDAYKIHMDRHTDKFGKSVCPICALHFSSEGAVRNHVTRGHSTRYSCLRCPLVTNHDEVAVNHAKWHRGVTFTCPHCLKVHRSRSGYMSHVRVQHPTDSVCTQCGFSFVNERGLRIHINLKHHNEDMENPCGPLCERCDIRFASGAAYRQHLDVSPKHAADGQRRRNTSQHNPGGQARYPKPVITVTCEECGEQFKGFMKYRHHFRQMHPDKTRTQYAQHQRCLCDQCGKSFKSIYALRDHKLTHTGKKQFQCDLCKKWFYLKATLAAHLKTHSEQQPVYACAVCDKKFVNKTNCNRHLWTHKEQKPHQCHACDKSFANASTLRSHVEYTHLKKPYPKKTRGPRQRASRARHAKEPVCGTIWPKNYVNADRQSDQTYDTRLLAAGEPQRPLLGLQHL